MSPPDVIRVLHMIEAIEQALSFVEGRERASLDDDAMLLLALTRAIEVVGEAAANVTPEGQRELPGVPWRAMVGMRNRLVHAYFDVDRDILWATVKDALPVLLGQLKGVVEGE